MTPDRHAQIAKRAYAMWELEGWPTGRDLEHWLRAEAELGTTQSAQTGSEAPPKRRRPTTKRS
ncbi:MAG: DUF2934 domain-containing protein [Roseiarcus sp.]|jgi:hypothetical protein